MRPPRLGRSATIGWGLRSATPPATPPRLHLRPEELQGLLPDVVADERIVSRDLAPWNPHVRGSGDPFDESLSRGERLLAVGLEPQRLLPRGGPERLRGLQIGSDLPAMA